MADEPDTINNSEIKEEPVAQAEAAQAEDPNAKYNEMREQMLRIAAEFDNYKKRTKTDIEKAKGLGKAELMRSMLPIIDEFEIAVVSMSEAQDKNMLKGVEMLYANFIGALKKEGLSEVGVDGTFDPYRHEIVMMREDGSERGTILEVVKKGYMLEDILIRPASVIVSEGKSENKEENITIKSE